MIATASWIGLVRVLSAFGPEALAGYNLGCFWLFEIPLAYLLAFPLGFGPSGVFVAIALAYSTLALVSAVLFKRGRWKVKRV